MDIANQAAIVSGGASGLGFSTAERLATAGARVTILDSNADLGQAAARAINGHFVCVDVVDEERIASAVLEAEGLHGIARILVNCAGVGPPQKVVDRDARPAPLSKFSRIVSVNLVGTFNVLAQFISRLARDPQGAGECGVIVNTASVAAYDGQIGQVAYSASKGGVVAMTLPLAREFARYGVRVMSVAPGIFETPILMSLTSKVRESIVQQVPFPKRLGCPEEFAQLVEAIIRNPMLNGEVIRLDGAIRMAEK